MLVTDFDTTDVTGRNAAGTVRGNRSLLKTLLAREGELRTFWFVYTESDNPEHFSPRHRHNFDQIRIGLGGVSSYGKHVLRERMIGYFPEGAYYGPHTVRELPTQLAALQMDGPSRSGYLSQRLIEPAARELKERGEFRKGIYYPHEGKAMEAFQATWAHAAGKPVVFPKPRFDEPVFMHLDAFAWVRTPEAGVETKRIAVFGDGDQGLRIGMIRLERGASHRFGDDRQSIIAFVLNGDARAGDQPLSRYSAVLLEPGETLALEGGSAQTELIELVLPEYAYENSVNARLGEFASVGR
jgi:hypothetical protein